MIECDAELCEYWTGFGCICAALGIDIEEEDEEDDTF